MRNLFLLISFLLLYSYILGQSEIHKLIILHTNDIHSNLNGFAPESNYSPQVTNNDNTIGGLSRISSINKE
ncbi:MAG: hypothetical protein LBV69_00965 [Bacteroidales bacterium]|jgi:2',3'-cyclic-nucleotide 2'-phosphodiesterase (5'-nucleotidase family)|nr:hypothetical protein [Bacteroidales bacterium]